MNLVAADVSPLILYWGSLSRLMSAATGAKRFMATMQVRILEVFPLHEPTLDWSPAFRRHEQLGPAKAGTPNRQQFTVPIYGHNTLAFPAGWQFEAWERVNGAVAAPVYENLRILSTSRRPRVMVSCLPFRSTTTCSPRNSGRNSLM